MISATDTAASEMAILRRIVDADQRSLSVDAARAILRLEFTANDRARMNSLAAKNRAGNLATAEEEELNNYLRVGQTLAILQSKARRALKAPRSPQRRKSGKS